jgi:sugar O-acyltransferase (sialic acid O-acetyltransferase NeuD family)
MKLNNSLLLIGGGGHCKSIIDSLLSRRKIWKKISILDNKIKVDTVINGFKVVGNDNDLKYFYDNGYTHAFISFGDIQSQQNRLLLYLKLKKIGYILPNIIDNSSNLSEFVTLKEGIFVGKNTIINSNTTIGNCVILNSRATIEHDCEIGDFTNIATSVVINGNVKIGKKCFLGSGTVVRNGVSIGENSIIGMGSIVIKDMPSNIIAFGNPCKVQL